MLASKLIEELRRLEASGKPVRVVAKAPIGDAGRIADLAFDEIANTVAFTYRNTADYDRNGEVGIPDITPIAENFQAKTNDGLGNDTLEAWVDGNADGEVGVPDVTPIAENYSAAVARYAILIKYSEGDDFLEIDSIAQSEASDSVPPAYSIDIPLGTAGYMAVQPFDAAGNGGEISNVVYVNAKPVGSAPEIVSVSPEGGTPSSSIKFSAVVFGSSSIHYYWDFGGASSPGSSEVRQPVVLLGSPGKYTVRLTVANDYGSDVYSFEFTVWEPPIASLVVTPELGSAPVTVTLDASGTDAPDLNIIKHEWDFDGDGAYDFDSGETAIVEHTYDTPGVYDVSVRVTDFADATDSASAEIRVNAPPIALLAGDGTESEPPFSVQFDASASSDPDGEIVSYEWDLDGSGNFELNSGTSPFAEREYTVAGDYNVAVRVTDDDGATDVAYWFIRVNGWHIIVVDAFGWVGRYPSLASIDGYPAVTYYDTTKTSLKYIRADEPHGLLWPTPTHLITIPEILGNSSLLEVNSLPAVAYVVYNAGAGTYDVTFQRAQDLNGNVWELPSIAMSLPSSHEAHLTLVGAKPAVICGEYYARSLDASGTSWTNPVQGWSTGTDGQSLLEIADAPGVALQSGEPYGLIFVGALDADGLNWKDPINVDYGIGTGGYTSLAIVNGRPAIAYLDEFFDRLKFVRAADSTGNIWDPPVVVYEATDAGAYANLDLFQGNPAIAYYDRNDRSVKFVTAQDPDGLTWNEPEVVDDNGNIGMYLQFKVINGSPMIVYSDSGNRDLKFAVWQ